MWSPISLTFTALPALRRDDQSWHCENYCKMCFFQFTMTQPDTSGCYGSFYPFTRIHGAMLATLQFIHSKIDNLRLVILPQIVSLSNKEHYSIPKLQHSVDGKTTAQFAGRSLVQFVVATVQWDTKSFRNHVSSWKIPHKYVVSHMEQYWKAKTRMSFLDSGPK